MQPATAVVELLRKMGVKEMKGPKAPGDERGHTDEPHTKPASDAGVERYVLEAKVDSTTWTNVAEVYPHLGMPSSFPNEDTARRAKAHAKNLIRAATYKGRKWPIRIRRMD